MEYNLYGFAIISLIILSIVAGKTGGSSIWKAIIRITIWGTVVMETTALVWISIWGEYVINHGVFVTFY